MSVPDNLPARGDVRRILIIKWSALGDVVSATTFMQDVCDAFPAAEIHLSTLPPFAKLFEGDPRFAKVIAINLRDRQHGFRRALEWIGEVRRNRYDLVVDIQSTDRSRILLGILKYGLGAIRWVIGNRPGLPYDYAPPADLPHIYPGWIVDAAFAAAGIPRKTPRAHLCLPDAVRRRVADLRAEHGLAAGRYAMFLPGCQKAGHLKRWGAERYAALGRLVVDAGWVDRVAVVGGPDEVEDCARVADALGEAGVNLNGRTAIQDVVALAEGAGFIVANDTGTGHLASCAARPMVVVCGPTIPSRVRPIGPDIVALQSGGTCLNCYLKECNHQPYHACMAEVPPEAVREAVAALRQGRLPSPEQLGGVRVYATALGT